MNDASYCNRCGVELEPGMDTCPLCGGVADQEPLDGGEYAVQAADAGRGRIPRREIYRRTTLLVLSTAFVVVTIVDLATTRAFTWSPIVWASLLLLGTAMVGPLRFHGFVRPFLLDVALAALLLLTIDAQDGGIGWFVPLGLPILFASGLVAAIVTRVLPRLRTLSSSATILGGAAIVCVVIDVVVSRGLYGSLALHWSWIVLVASVPVVLFLVIFEQTVGRYVDFRRRFHL